MPTLAEKLEALPILDSLQREENPLSNGGKWEAAGAGNIGKATLTGLVTQTAGQELRAAYVAAPFALAAPCAVGYMIAALIAETKGCEIHLREAGGFQALGIEIQRTAAGKCTVRLEVNEAVVKTVEGVALGAGDAFFISIESGTYKVWRKPSAESIVEIASVAAAVGSTFADCKLHVWDTGTAYRITNFRAGSLQAPGATTEPAGAIGKTTAALNGKVNPHGVSTEYWFEYGTTEALGSKTTVGSAGEGTAEVAKTKELSGLAAATKYFFRLIAKNANGEVAGAIASFTTEAEATFGIVSKSSKPPLELDVEVQPAESTDPYRWDPSSRLASKRPQAISFGTAKGEGNGPGAVTITRRVMKDYEDLNLLDKVRFIGRNGEEAYCGRHHDFARTNDPLQQFAITTVGPMALAQTRKFREIYVDRALVSWNAMSTARKAALYTLGYGPDAAPMADAPDDAGNPSLSTIATGKLNKPWFEFTYDALGAKVAILYIGSITRINLGTHATDANVFFYPFAANDLAHNGEETGVDLSALASYEYIPASPKGVVGLSGYYNAAGGGAEGTQYGWRIAGVVAIGPHGLTLYGVAPNQGPVVSDVLKHIFTTFTPLKWSADNTVTTYPVQQASFNGVYPLDAAKSLNNLHMLELSCFEDETVYYYAADLTRADWQVRTDEKGVRFNPLQGDSIEGFANGVEVTFTDYTGRTRTIYPDENAELRDESETNPANQHAIKLWKDLTIPFPCPEADAIQMGRAYLAEYNRPKAPGTITIQGGYIQDDGYHWQQGWKVHQGETLALTDHPNDAPRLITSTSWDQDRKALSISVDNGAELLEAFFARVSNAREAANRN